MRHSHTVFIALFLGCCTYGDITTPFALLYRCKADCNIVTINTTFRNFSFWRLQVFVQLKTRDASDHLTRMTEPVFHTVGPVRAPTHCLSVHYIAFTYNSFKKHAVWHIFLKPTAQPLPCSCKGSGYMFTANTKTRNGISVSID
jgi:hypothetical protein